jgi:hypothetical protein
MTNHRRTKRRRNQKGGFWPFTNSDVTSSTQSQGWGDYFSNWGNKAKESTSGLLNSANSLVGQAATTVTDTANQAVASTGSMLNQNIEMSSPEQVQPQLQPQQNIVQPQQNIVQPQPIGGKRRIRRSMKGGKVLTYYASPVSGLKVAEPTTWIGGSRKRKNKGKKSRRTRRHKRR